MICDNCLSSMDEYYAMIITPKLIPVQFCDFECLKAWIDAMDDKQ